MLMKCFEIQCLNFQIRITKMVLVFSHFIQSEHNTLPPQASTLPIAGEEDIKKKPNVFRTMAEHKKPSTGNLFNLEAKIKLSRESGK